MIIVEWLSKCEGVCNAALSAPNHVFSLIWILDNSAEIIAWKIHDYVPEEFGWSPHWNKLCRAVSYTREQYGQVL